ncbi:hypothetical protein [Pseudomonas mandelii]|uniref:hypothetical protein n=1 Tax=Pseudomonas mandelii TaxID=75612 RepID=UPI0011401A17|nr:hypothetical protein [Pseudomonas mandelii]
MNWFANSLLRNLRVGSVVYTWCDFCTPPKNKYLLVVSLSPRLLVLVINSEINQFYVVKGQQQFHVLVPQAEHPFLQHNSHACCIEAIEAFDLTFMHASLLANYSAFHRGHITSRCLKDVYDAVQTQKIMRKVYKAEIVSALEYELMACIES